MKIKSLLYGLTTACIVLLLDQWSKQWILHFLKSQPDHAVPVTSFFHLVTVWNRGISFGLFSQSAYQPWIFAAIASAITLFLVIWLLRTDTLLQRVALGLVIGGAIGNVIDRIRFGAVFDFLDFFIGHYHWPAFNIADAAVCVGVILLCSESLFGTSSPKKTRKEEQ